MHAIFVAPIDTRTRITPVIPGLVKSLDKSIKNAGYFKPVGDNYSGNDPVDNDTALLNSLFHFQTNTPFSLESAKDLIVSGKEDSLLDTILESYFTIAKGKNFVVIQGTSDFNVNVEIAKNLDVMVLLVADGSDRSTAEMVTAIKKSQMSHKHYGCNIAGVIVTNVPEIDFQKIKDELTTGLENQDIALFGVIPFSVKLARPKISDIVKHLQAEVLYGKDYVSNRAVNTIIADREVSNLIQYHKEGTLLITAVDRAEHILSALLIQMPPSKPNLAGIILTGGKNPKDAILKLTNTIGSKPTPIIWTNKDTCSTIVAIDKISVSLEPDDKDSIDTTFDLVERNVDSAALASKIQLRTTKKRTPKLFQYELIEMARANKKHIVMPEGSEPRTLQAVEQILARGITDITLIGPEDEIINKAKELNVNIKKAQIINPLTSKNIEKYAEQVFELRRHKGVTIENAREMVKEYVYFGTMMIYNGEVDGLVSGAIHATKDTISPALQVIKTKPGISTVSSIFFMCLPDQVLVFGDCAVMPNPTPEQLAEIAISSAETASKFSIEPRVAMLSYSTGDSGKGPDVDAVKEATAIAKKKQPDLLVEGPLQFDAAFAPEVAAIKLKDSKVAGKATVYIFPSLEAGNIAYKAVQRSANCVAIGPVLQGMNKPVNDLSRGCLVEDIVYTVTVTAIQS